MNIKGRPRVYIDTDGNELTLDQMVRREPDWAANRIRAGEIAIDKIERLERELAKARSDALHNEKVVLHDKKDMAMLIGRLAYAHKAIIEGKKFDPTDLVEKALGYLKRNNLEGNIVRALKEKS